MKVPQDLTGDFSFLPLVFQSRWTLGAYLEQQARPHWNVHRGPAGHPFQSTCGAERTECESYPYSTKILPSSRKRGKSWEDWAKACGANRTECESYSYSTKILSSSGKRESPGRTGQKAWDQGFQIGDCTRQERLEGRRGRDREIQSNQCESSRCYMELCSVLCGSLDGRSIWGRMDTRTRVAEPLCCAPETVTASFVSYLLWLLNCVLLHGLQHTRLPCPSPSP